MGRGMKLCGAHRKAAGGGRCTRGVWRCSASSLLVAERDHSSNNTQSFLTVSAAAGQGCAKGQASAHLRGATGGGRPVVGRFIHVHYIFQWLICFREGRVCACGQDQLAGRSESCTKLRNSFAIETIRLSKCMTIRRCLYGSACAASSRPCTSPVTPACSRCRTPSGASQALQTGSLPPARGPTGASGGQLSYLTKA